MSRGRAHAPKEHQHAMPATTTTVKDQLNELTATVAQLTTSTDPADMLYLPEPDENDKDVHTEHCCNVHGCKYDEMNCLSSSSRTGAR